MGLNLHKLLSSEDLTLLVDKINRNFSLIAANGGGPIGDPGETGRTGFVGPPGGPGPSGGRGIQGSIWMYSTTVPVSFTENVTPDIYDSITPETPRRGDFLILTKRDGTFSKVYKFETTTGSPTIPIWNEVVELNTQNALYLKLDIFRFNDYTRTFPGPAATYKSICYEDNTTAKNYQNRFYLQNRKDYLIFTGDNLSSGQNLTNFQKVTIDKLLEKNEYTDAKLPKGKFNILSGDNPHMTFLYFQDQEDTELVTYPLSGDNILSDVLNTTDPLKKLVFNGNWSTLKMTENGTLIFESTGDIQVNPKTNNQPNGKFSIFGKTLVLQGSTIIDQTLGYAPVSYFNATTGNTILIPKNTYDVGGNPDGQVELAIYPKAPSSIPAILALNNFIGFDATSKFSGLGTAQEGKELLGFLDINLEKLGVPTILSASNRRILVAGGTDATPFGYDYKKLEDISIPEKDRPNVFQKRNKLDTINTISSLITVPDVTNESALPIGSNVLVQSTTDIYGRTPAAITTTNDGNVWKITSALTNNVIVNRVYIYRTETDDPILPITSMVGLKMTFVNNTGKQMIFKRWLSATEGVLTSGKWDNTISSNPNSVTDILPGYDVITVKNGARIIMTVTSVTVGTVWCVCQCELDSTSDLSSFDSNVSKGLTFKEGKKYLINGSNTTASTAAQKEVMYNTQNQLISGGIYGSNPNFAANGSGVLFLDATTDAHTLIHLDSPEAAALINRIDISRLGPNLKYGTRIKLRIDPARINVGSFSTAFTIKFARESSYLAAFSGGDAGIIVIPDYEYDMIKNNIGSYVAGGAGWFILSSTANTMLISYTGYSQSTELELTYRNGFYNTSAAFVNFGHFVLTNHSVIVAGILGRLTSLNASITATNNLLLAKFAAFDVQQYQDYGGLFDYTVAAGGVYGLATYTVPANGKINVVYNSSLFIPDLGGIMSCTLQIRRNGTVVSNMDLYNQDSSSFWVRLPLTTSWAGDVNNGDSINLRIVIGSIDGGSPAQIRGNASIIFIPN